MASHNPYRVAPTEGVEAATQRTRHEVALLNELAKAKRNVNLLMLSLAFVVALAGCLLVVMVNADRRATKAEARADLVERTRW